MIIRFYLDEDSSDTDLLRALRLRGSDVVSAPEAGMRGRQDEEQLKWAIEHQRVLYGFNRRDFSRIHAEWMQQGLSHEGIVLAMQQEYSVGEQMRRLLRLANTLSAEQMRNRLEFLSTWGSRASE